MIDTVWKLANLQRRPELNNVVVRVESVRNDRFVVKPLDSNGPHAASVLVKPSNLVSVNDPSVTGDLLQGAVAHLENSTMDERLRHVAKLFAAGQHDQALTLAGKWTIDKLPNKAGAC